MSSEGIRRTALTFIFLLIAIPSFAHHGASEYDMTKIVSLNGTVKELQFVNPHTLLTFTVKDDAGKASEWQGSFPVRICCRGEAGAGAR